MNPQRERQMAELCVFVHGVLAGFHLLGVAYNWKKRNWSDVAAHTAAAAYDGWAVHKHMKDICAESD